MDKMTLEETFAGLEEVIQKMEQGEATLEESFQLYHKGMDLLKSCNDKIDKIEKKMQPKVLNKRCAIAVRNELRFVVAETSKRVRQVPMFIPKTIKAAL